MSEEIQCGICGTVFQGNYYLSAVCSICKAAEAQERREWRRESDRQRVEAERQLEREQAYVNAEAARAQVESNAETAREQERQTARAEAAANAKLRNDETTRRMLLQARVNAEEHVTPEEAYDLGFHYVDVHFSKNNIAGLIIQIDELGKIKYLVGSPYLADVLNLEFSRGLGVWMKNVKGASRDYLLIEAMKMGRKIAKYPDDKTTFNLPTGVVIGGVAIESIDFKKYFKTSIIEETGKLDMVWKPPFEDPGLNKAFLEGILTEIEAQNTAELVQPRLMEIAKLIQSRERWAAVKKGTPRSQVKDLFKNDKGQITLDSAFKFITKTFMDSFKLPK